MENINSLFPSEFPLAESTPFSRIDAQGREKSQISILMAAIIGLCSLFSNRRGVPKIIDWPGVVGIGGVATVAVSIVYTCRACHSLFDFDPCGGVGIRVPTSPFANGPTSVSRKRAYCSWMNAANGKWSRILECDITAATILLAVKHGVRRRVTYRPPPDWNQVSTIHNGNAQSKAI